MGNLVYLNIDTDEGLLFIPFTDLEKLDLFTIGFENKEELITNLNKILDLSINLDEVNNIYISGERYKKSNRGSLDHIKYRKDNFNYKSLCDMFSLYLKQDRRRIRNNNIRNVITEGMVKFKGGRFISDKDIDLAVKVFFDKDYKNQRDSYFLIKDFAAIKINSLPKESRVANQLGLHQLEATTDDFYQYLIELSSRGTDEFDMAMEELSKSSLEEISKALKGNYQQIMDGVANRDITTDEDAYLLEYCTGRKISELQDLLFEFRTDNFFGHKR